MLILLPPSEGKHSPEKGSALKLNEISFDKGLREVRRNLVSSIDHKKCLPAHQIYTGVLYQALDFQGLTISGKKRAAKSIVIISALFGALRLTDVIPSYKLKIKSSLWKSAITEELESLNAELIIDCRSSTYMGVWTPNPIKTVVVRVFQVKDGKKSVITHMSKKYRGELTRILLLESKEPKSPADVLRIAKQYYKAELVSSTEKEPFYLDLLITP